MNTISRNNKRYPLTERENIAELADIPFVKEHWIYKYVPSYRYTPIPPPIIIRSHYKTLHRL